MKLKSFGCSFIFGSDLSAGLPNWNSDLPSQATWPARLAQKLNCRYGCYARPGAGNLQILNQVLAQISQSDSDDVFIIGWTWTDRFDYYDIDSDSSTQSSWKSILPVDKSKLASVYYQQIHSEYLNKLTSLIYIKTAVDALQQKNLKFVMTYMDHILFDRTWHTDPSICFLQDCVAPHMTTFDGMNFLDWSRKNGFSESKNWHPLEQAHQAAADYIIDNLKGNV